MLELLFSVILVKSLCACASELWVFNHILTLSPHSLHRMLALFCASLAEAFLNSSYSTFCFLFIVQWVACASVTVHYSSPVLKRELLVSSWIFLWLLSQQYLIASQLLIDLSLPHRGEEIVLDQLYSWEMRAMRDSDKKKFINFGSCFVMLLIWVGFSLQST